jgi:hypothetical protein
MAGTQTILNDSEGLDAHPDTVPAVTMPWIEAMRRRRRRHPQRRIGRFVKTTTGPTELVETPYVASGGLSSLIQLDDEELQVEIHRASFALHWSTDLLADAVIRNIQPLLPNAPLEAEVVFGDGLPMDKEPAAAMEAIVQGEDARQIVYLRLQFEDRAVSWEQRRVSLLGSSRWFVAAQVGLVADRLDEAYIEAMIERTASRRLAPIAADLAWRAGSTVGFAGRFPVGEFEETRRTSSQGMGMS